MSRLGVVNLWRVSQALACEAIKKAHINTIFTLLWCHNFMLGNWVFVDFMLIDLSIDPWACGCCRLRLEHWQRDPHCRRRKREVGSPRGCSCPGRWKPEAQVPQWNDWTVIKTICSYSSDSVLPLYPSHVCSLNFRLLVVWSHHWGWSAVRLCPMAQLSAYYLAASVFLNTFLSPSCCHLSPQPSFLHLINADSWVSSDLSRSHQPQRPVSGLQGDLLCRGWCPSIKKKISWQSVSKCRILSRWDLITTTSSVIINIHHHLICHVSPEWNTRIRTH